MRPVRPVLATWPLVAEHPIFTEHVSGQYSWMLEIFVERRVWEARYADGSGLILSSELQRRCRTGGGEQGAAFPTSGGINLGGSGLSAVTAVPEPAALSVLSLGAVLLSSRRRRKLGSHRNA